MTPDSERIPRGPAPIGRRQLILAGLVAAVAIAALYVLVPAIAGLEDTWRRLSAGDSIWLLAALVFEILSYLSYVALFHAVFLTGPMTIGWRVSYRITMAGVVASRVLALAGAGGIAVTAWALRRVGLPGRDVAARLAAFFILLYGVFMAGMLIGGLGLWSGLLAGPAPAALTLAPAAFGAVVIVAVLVIAAVSKDLEEVLDHSPAASRSRRALAAAPATVSSGVGATISLLRSPRPGLLGGVGWFAFDIAVLWACLAAFGGAPPAAVVVMAYFIGLVANTLPVPGGIGAVEGGMIGALIAFGVDGGQAIVGVLGYRAFAFWLPIIPGAVAYLELLREPGRSTPHGSTGARDRRDELT
ncbi:MAG TPA: lysylphosphatidylglycerol synthase transmembrane domain-containing protein [Solirubrobacterales bacterium]|nr:lysylphosphatidylglycerol synthase transmembrane domain-containing protein [Solirubrobacterales bacterium]